MKITKDEIQHIAKLARIRFTDAELVEMTRQIDSIIREFKKIEEIHLPDIEKIAIGEEVKTIPVLRKDEAKIFPDKSKLFINTREVREDFIQVPKIID